MNVEVADIETKMARTVVSLADAIQQASEWQAWERAKAAFQSDAQLASKLDRYGELSRRWRNLRMQGRSLAGKDAIELAQLQELIQQSPPLSAARENRRRNAEVAAANQHPVERKDRNQLRRHRRPARRLLRVRRSQQ